MSKSYTLNCFQIFFHCSLMVHGFYVHQKDQTQYASCDWCVSKRHNWHDFCNFALECESEHLLFIFICCFNYFEWESFFFIETTLCVCACVCVCVCACLCVFAHTQGGDGYQHYKVRARLAVFNKHFKEAESIYLEGVSEKLHIVCTFVIIIVLLLMIVYYAFRALIYC